MVTPFYTRPGLNVDIYDSDRNGVGLPHEGDVAFFAGLAERTGRRILELGCGTGRVALPLAEAGYKVTGLDLSVPMLERARENARALSPENQQRLRFVEGDMTGFDLPGAFDLVIIAFRSFQMLLTPEDERNCLETIHRHLAPGGRLVIDVFDPLLDLLAPGTVTIPESDARPVRRGTHPATGNTVSVSTVLRTNRVLEQVLEEIWRFTETNAAGETVREEEEVLRMRWIYRYEMRHLLELCGFDVEAEYSDFHGSPPAYGKEQVWVGRRQ